VVCPGIQLDWQKVPGLSETLGKNGVSSNYLAETAPKTWDFIRGLRKGTAVFGMPSGPIKCAGALQKIAYLAADYWRQQGVLQDIRVVMVLPTPGMFGVAVFAKDLERVAKGYGIEVHFNSEVVEVDSGRREALAQGQQERHQGHDRVRRDAPGPATERARVGTGDAARRPGESGRVRAGRQEHAAAHALPECVRAR